MPDGEPAADQLAADGDAVIAGIDPPDDDELLEYLAKTGAFPPQ